MVSKHAPELLDLIQQRDNTASTATWIKDNFAKILASEVDVICSRLRPTRGGDVSEVLREFSLDRVLKEATTNAPNLAEIVLANFQKRLVSSLDRYPLRSISAEC
jgi:hypothetical protein